jgi:hypothetical protein
MRSNAHALSELNRKGFPGSYYGDYPDWLQVLGQTRDSGTLDRANFKAALNILIAIDADSVGVERAGHWACGWVETIIIDPDNAAIVKSAQAILDAMENYPIVNEELFSEMEWEETVETWENMGASKRIALAKYERSRYHWLGKANILRYARMSLHTLVNDTCPISNAMRENLRG